MSDEKGFLTKKQEKRLAQIIDDAVKLKGLGELVDGYAAKILVTVVDDSLLEKVPVSEEIKVLLGQLADAAMDENVELANELAADILNTLIDVPVLDENSEAILFNGAVTFIVGTILDWIKKKK